MSDYLCNDCLDTGWIEDREGKTVCACISETEPYQLLRAELDALKPDAERYRVIRAANVIQLRKIERWLYETPEELDAAIDALRGEGGVMGAIDEYRMQKDIDRMEIELAERDEFILELRAEVEALRPDAERYRWLRENADMQFGSITNHICIFQPTTHSTEWIDSNIDALRGEGEK